MAVFAFSYLHSLSELTCDGFVADDLPEEDEIDGCEGVDNFETVGIVVDAWSTSSASKEHEVSTEQ